MLKTVRTFKNQKVQRAESASALVELNYGSAQVSKIEERKERGALKFRMHPMDKRINWIVLKN